MIHTQASLVGRFLHPLQKPRSAWLYSAFRNAASLARSTCVLPGPTSAEHRQQQQRRSFTDEATGQKSVWKPPANVKQNPLGDKDSKDDIISIDRSGLKKYNYDTSEKATDGQSSKTPPPPTTPLGVLLQEKIKLRGPLSVASYMRECLTHPTLGYYMGRDVFGESGDFITSPELSQMFGEMIAIWFVTTWEKLGYPQKINLVELGPGRGTLSADILKFTSKFAPLKGNVNLNLVEVSPHLRQIQYEKLGCVRYVESPREQAAETPKVQSQFSKDIREIAKSIKGVQSNQAQTNSRSVTAVRNDGSTVSWYDSFAALPRDPVPTIVIAHEFFDALPVHVFEFTKLGWCERLIDVDTTNTSSHFRFVLSPGPTPASAAFMKFRGESASESAPKPSIGDVIEVCPNAMAIAEDLSRFLHITKGASLIIDYGADAPFSNSLRSIQKHKIHDFFYEPGKSDLTAMVDFSAIRRTAARAKSPDGTPSKLHIQGPVTQRDFLLQLGIDVRLNILLQIATPEQAKILQRGYDILTSGTEMGSTFKCMAMSVSPNPAEKLDLVGFASPSNSPDKN